MCPRVTVGIAIIMQATGCTSTVGPVAGRLLMRAVRDAATGQIDIVEGEHPVLRYNYQTVQVPTGLIEQVQPNSRKYAQPRSNYIHPLYGPDGEVLTLDWPPGHPHHRGIYWAWPEVRYKDQLGDLHALQRVFARPTGNIQLRNGNDYAQIEAENRWIWEDEVPIVLETTVIRAWRSGGNGRYIDLTFTFKALEDGVTLARRNTDKYGGLSARLSPIEDVRVVHHADPPEANPRRAWLDSIGIRCGGTQPVGLAVFEKAANPHYPGDFVQYPDLAWFQPTFPKAGARFALNRDAPLTLQYRLWIRCGGQVSEEEYSAQWQAYNGLRGTP
jgi:hypothetical protein